MGQGLLIPDSAADFHPVVKDEWEGPQILPSPIAPQRPKSAPPAQSGSSQVAKEESMGVEPNASGTTPSTPGTSTGAFIHPSGTGSMCTRASPVAHQTQQGEKVKAQATSEQSVRGVVVNIM